MKFFYIHPVYIYFFEILFIFTFYLNKIFTEETRRELNDLRDRQIEKIKELKESNLRHSKATEDEFREKRSHVIDDKSLEYKQKIDKIKEELILEDCVLLDNPNFPNGLDL